MRDTRIFVRINPHFNFWEFDLETGDTIEIQSWDTYRIF